MKLCPTCKTEFDLDASFCPHDADILIARQDPADPDPRLGTALGGRYLLVRRIADGANGRVYEARDTTDRAQLAVKVLHKEVARDATSCERLKREAETALTLDDPHVLRVVGYFEEPPDVHYLAMEFLRGEELSALLAREKRLPLARTVRILSQVSLALDHAHEKGLVHRDLKPENIFLCRSEEGEDEVKILDFGSVKLQQEKGPKLTAFGTTLGSPYYMAPEQALALPTLDRRADVFAVGAILYEMITGKIAFAGNNVATILFKLLNEEPLPPTVQAEGLPAEVDEVLEEALAKQPGLRFPTVGALADAFGRALGLAGTPADWANTGVSELEARTGSSRPAPAPARGEQTAPVPVESGRSSSASAPPRAPRNDPIASVSLSDGAPSFDDRISLDFEPRPGPSPLLIAALAALGVVVLAVLGVMLWWLS